MTSKEATKTPIRGRDAELKVTDALLRSVVQGCGDVVVIEGPPGIGKSRLATELLIRAERSGARTLDGKAFEYQQAVPFFCLFTAINQAEPAIVDPETLHGLGESADLRYGVVHNLSAAIRRAASQSPLVICLDDVHWADTPTVIALRTLTATLRDAPVLWVLSARAGAGGPAVNDLLNELGRHQAVFLRLPAIPPRGVIDMTEDVVRARADVSLVAMAEKTSGNPFLLTELLGGLQEEGRLTIKRGWAVVTGDALPQRLSVSMRQRLDALTETTRDLVRVAAVLPDRFSAALLARMLERPPTALVSAIDEAVTTDLLVNDGDELRFSHDLLRQATRQALPQSLRRAIERQSATVMMQLGATPEQVAAQLARSAHVGDDAAVAALRAAARAVAESDQSAAADLSRRALELLPKDDDRRGELLGETLSLLNGSARFKEAEELAIAMLSKLSPEEEAQVRLRIPVATDSLEDRIAENRRSLQLGNISDVIRARHHAWLACNDAVSGSAPNEVLFTEAITAARATGDAEALLICEVALAIRDYVDGHALRALKRIEAIDVSQARDDLSFTYSLVGIHHTNVLTQLDRLDDAASVVKRGLEAASRQGGDVAHALWTLHGAMIELVSGRLAAARATLNSVPLQSWGSMSEMSMNRWLILSEVAVSTGDRKLLHTAVSEARAANPGGPNLVNQGAAYILALAAWHCGDVGAAARHLNRESVLNFLWPNAFEQFILTARVATAASDAGLRTQVLQGLEILDHNSGQVDVFAAVAQYVRGILERNATTLTTAATLLGTRPLLSACAGEDAGTALVHSGDSASGIHQLTAAFDSYTRCEAVEDARRVGRRLRQLGVQVRVTTSHRPKEGWESLTDAEFKVINLIAEGATNATVAERLYLSPNTVKTHARNAFGKLGISSRRELLGTDGSKTSLPPRSGNAS